MASQGDSAEAQASQEVGQGSAMNLDVQSDAVLERTLRDAKDANNQLLVDACEEQFALRLRNQRRSLLAKAQQIATLQAHLEALELQLNAPPSRRSVGHSAHGRHETQPASHPVSHPAHSAGDDSPTHYQQHALLPHLSIKVD